MAACVVLVQIVKDMMIMGGKTASTTVCDLTANQKGRKSCLVFPEAEYQYRSVFPEAEIMVYVLNSMCINAIHTNVLAGSKNEKHRT